MNILIVEDDTELGGSTAGVLEQEHAVTLVTTSDEALDRLLELPYDAVIADYHLGDERGSDLLELVAVLFPRVRRILYSAAPDAARHHALVHVVIPKPAPPAELLAALAARDPRGERRAEPAPG